MNVGVPMETQGGERRVALVPESVGPLLKAGLRVLVERGAGEAAGFLDAAYEQAGATIVPDAASLFRDADILLKVQPPSTDEVQRMKAGSAVLGFLQPLTSPELLEALAGRSVTGFSMELVPRITRAQKMDALSSQATVAGYKAVLMAADSLGRIFPMLMTAAGTIPPARVLILGAGVAGLQAIATARRLGAVVEAFDVRPAVKEQVESLGAKFVGIVDESAQTAGGYAKEVSADFLKRQREHLHRLVKDADAVITTAQVPGKRAPLLVTADMVRDMKPGSVIVDLASESGGNCELTEAGQDVVKSGVRIIGPINLVSRVPLHASQMYSRNVVALLQHLVKDGALQLDMEDEITRGSCVTHGGEVVHGRKAAAGAAG